MSELIAAFEEQAKWCADLGSPFMVSLLRHMAADAAEGGIVAELAARLEGSPRRMAVPLRLAGALHYAVLRGRAEAFAALYPSGLKNSYEIQELWPCARDWLAENIEEAAQFIQSDPQTNETRRSIALLPGFLAVAARYRMPLRLLELGASAGLNQGWDHFHYQTDSWAWGKPSPVEITTDWQGPAPAGLDAPIHIESRRACDLSPVDIYSEDAALRLKAYAWPDQFERLSRLDFAIDLAKFLNVTVERSAATEWIQGVLKQPSEGVVRVVYHSVFMHYPPKAEREALREAILEAGQNATPSTPLAWLCMEAESVFSETPDHGRFVVRLQTWPGGETKILGRTDGHVRAMQYGPVELDEG